MRLVIIILLLFADPGSSIHKVARANKAKTEAEKAYKAQNYKEALKKYQYLTDSLKVGDQTLMLDKAHCYYKLKDNDNAQKTYSALAHASDKSISTIANQQLGLMAYEQKDLGKALNYFKASLKAYPNNQEARYNYELVKKLMKDQEKNDQKQNQNNKNQQDQNKDQNKDQKQNEKDQKNEQDKKDQQDQQNKEDKEGKQDKQQQNQDKSKESKNKGQEKDKDKSGEGESDEKKKEEAAKEKQAKEEGEKDKKGDKKEQNEMKDKGEQGKKGEQGEQQQQSEKEAEKLKKENISRKLKELNLSEEKARMILEAMRSNEVQYLQQVKKRPKYVPDRNKPDW